MEAYSRNFYGTDEASLVEPLNQPVVVVPGSPLNLKITTPDDLALAEAILPCCGGKNVRVGLGYDAHRLVAGRPLILGGVTIPYTLGLLGHSDADVLSHAIGDALLGAVGAGDLGRTSRITTRPLRTSPASSCWKIIEIVRQRGYQPVNLDATVVAQAPRLGPHFPEMLRSSPRSWAWPRKRSISRPPPPNRWASPAGARGSRPMRWFW